MANFLTERDGQIDFYSTFLPRIDPNLQLEEILADNNDGVLRGNLLEFKLRVSNLNETLFQCIKYLSVRRIKGKPVPANIVIVDLNAECAYLYSSADYLADIEKVYIGAASKGNRSFVGKQYNAKFHYGKQKGAAGLITVLRSENWTKIHINEDCVVGWASAYYAQNPTARKEDFVGEDTGKHKTVGELRNPIVFADYIYPYRGKTNKKFNYLMDKLNDPLLRKNIGAFYTPELYARKSHELLRQAIARVPEGNDYIILDRCAGTGNLELFLTDEELSHCIVSTVEYYEYKVLQELLGAKVRHIIPPIETSTTFNKGLVNGADALSQNYINNPEIRQYLDDPKCTVILFENPPYAETTSVEHQKRGVGASSSSWKQSFVVSEMKKEVSGTASNDLGNAFIWSGFKYYLRQPTDSYVVYSPVKYWKAQHLINKKFLGGFAFNRRHFHTNIDACIMVALWSNTDASLDKIELQAFDIDEKSNDFVSYGVLDVRRIYTLYSKVYYDKRVDSTDIPGSVLLGYDGTPARAGVKTTLKPIFNHNIIGYMVIDGSNFDNPDLMSVLIRCGLYKGHGYYLRSDNYLEKLPMFCASRYITYNRIWTERARIMKSADGAKLFKKALPTKTMQQWLLRCLLFTCLETQNHMRSFEGSDGRFYRNELCLDTTNGQTLASKAIRALKLTARENKLLTAWQTLMKEVKKTAEYNPRLTYGVFQIMSEIDTFIVDPQDNKTRIYNNVAVHSALLSLKQLVKAYYNAKIVPTLLKYEFLK